MATSVDPPASISAVLDEPIAHGRGRALLRYAVPGAIALIVIGVGLRFWTLSDLWLDEALTVNIAKLPLHSIPAALRHDGAPPLYYVLLHFWIRLFGQGDVAVRSLSGVASVVALPFAWAAGKRLGGRPTAWAALVLMATSPFAISYATSARMYSMMTLWGLLGVLALVRALERPSRGRLACVALVTAVLLYTHYWALYFVVVAAIWLLFRARRATATDERTEAEERRNSRAVFAAMVVGGVLFLPWVPTFIFQTLHTGTPWSNAAGPADILGILGEYSGGGYFGGGPWGYALGLAVFTLVLLGLFGRTIDDRRVLLELRTRRRARPIAWIFMGTLVLAVVAGAIGQAAFVGRYTAVVFPLFILLAALGASVFADRRVMAGVLGAAAVAGLIVSVGTNATQRTEAGLIANAINKGANPGDLVVYCPDQLGPAVNRLLHAPVDQATFPRAASPERIDWVDYRKVISATDAVQFGQDMVARAGAGHAIWLVYRSGYPGLGRQCQTLASLFESQRPNGQMLVANDGSTYYEHAGVVRFPG